MSHHVPVFALQVHRNKCGRAEPKWKAKFTASLRAIGVNELGKPWTQGKDFTGFSEREVASIDFAWHMTKHKAADGVSDELLAKDLIIDL
eukprot:4259881-Amphidinium_carterae.1